MKKFLNSPEDAVEGYISGLVQSSALLARVSGWPVIVRARAARKDDGRVALISGGGSGHEPAHAGYVGQGMLDAAVLGPVFTSPSVDAVHAAIRAVATDAGVILIVKNYTGDRLNFGLAAELARAEGIRVELVIVADDASLGDTSRAGRRGLAGAVLVHKILGAAAERGWSLGRLVDLANTFMPGMATTGLALGPSFVPGATAPSFELGDDEVEWGLGIHGEAGLERGTLRSSAQIAARLVDIIAADRGLEEGEEVVALVNGLGGTPDLELRTLQGDVLRALGERGVTVHMTWAGSFLTSLEMPGASLTIARTDAVVLSLLCDPVSVNAFPHLAALLEPGRETEVEGAPAYAIESPAQGEPVEAVVNAASVVRAIAECLLRAEPHLTELDQSVGDGDLGINLARAAHVLLSVDDDLRAQPSVERCLAVVAQMLRQEIGGTSGPLYSLLVLAMGDALRDCGAPTARDWVTAVAAGVARVRAIGGAAPGDSTMVDALQPAVDAMRAAPEDSDLLTAAALAARAGADSTASLRPTLGRSSYVGERAVGVPDPGAVAIALQFEAVQAMFEGRVG